MLGTSLTTIVAIIMVMVAPSKAMSVISPCGSGLSELESIELLPELLLQ